MSGEPSFFDDTIVESFGMNWSYRPNLKVLPRQYQFVDLHPYDAVGLREENKLTQGQVEQSASKSCVEDQEKYFKEVPPGATEWSKRLNELPQICDWAYRLLFAAYVVDDDLGEPLMQLKDVQIILLLLGNL